MRSLMFFLRFAVILSGIALITACGAGDPASERSENLPPNILFILTDDQGWGDLGTFYQNERGEKEGVPWLKTPNIDRMASEGVQLTHHYCNAPVCAPSRASLLLGVHQGHSNVRDNQFDKRLEDNYTMAGVLKEGGYKTVAVGKWGLQGDGQWSEDGDEWPGHPLNRGFDEFYGYMRHRDGHEHYPVEGPYRGPKEVWHNREEVSSGLAKCYTGDLWTAYAKKWIADHQRENADQPFFMFLSYDTPHATIELPTLAYPAGGGLEGGLQWLGESGHMINTASGEIDSWTHPDYAERTWDDDGDPATAEVPWPDTYKRFATVIRRIDDAVGDIRRLLADLNLEENTIVVFTTDNGPSAESYLPEGYAVFTPEFFRSYGPFDGIKRDVWEGGVRVPAVIVQPGRIPKNRVSEAPVMMSDWMATFCDAAGLTIPERSDGESLLPVIRDGKSPRRPVYVEYFQAGSTPGYSDFAEEHQDRKRGQMQMIRFGDLLGIRYDIRSQEDDFEIYNMKSDPGQRKNLYNGTDYRQLQASMKERVLQMRVPDPGAPRPYDKAPIPAVKRTPIHRGSGLRLAGYDTDSRWIPRTDHLTPLREEAATSVRPVPDFEGNLLEYSGYIEVPEAGVYDWKVQTPHQVIVRWHESMIIDADYQAGNPEKLQARLPLQPGFHPVRICLKKERGEDWDFEFLVKSPDSVDYEEISSKFLSGS